jgi:hypothetical protein
VKFTLGEDATVNIAVNAEATALYQWISFCNYTLQTNDDSNIALIAYNIALNDAITARDNASYTNVKGTEKANLLAAIDADDGLDKNNKTAIESATNALSEATTAFTNAKSSYDALATAINSASGIVTAAINVGNGAFQIPVVAKTTLEKAKNTANSAWEAADATAVSANDAAETLNTAITTYNDTELNAPADDTRYVLTFHCDGHNSDGNAVTLIHDGRADAGLYGIKYLTTSNSSYAQSFKFTSTGTANCYYLSQIDKDGTERYFTTDKLAYNPSNGNASGIRTTSSDDASIYLPVEIQSAGLDGHYYLINTTTGGKLAHNGNNNNDMYTNNSATFTIAVAEKASVSMSINSSIKIATRIFPFTADIPDGVKAYTCETVKETILTLTENESGKFAANTPYVIYAKDGIETKIEGYGTAKQDAYTSGLLTGVYTATSAPVGSYVLQNGDEGVAFYKVADGKQPTVGANRAYLQTLAGARALYVNFDNEGETTAVSTLKALTNGKFDIYNTSGVRQNSLQKGMNILKMEDGSIRKVMIK